VRTVSLVNAKSDATTISSFACHYDAAANPTSVLEGNGDRVTYSYDALNQFTTTGPDACGAVVGGPVT